jgi:hypothetical protein
LRRYRTLEVLKDKYGTVVANDGLGLTIALGITDLHATANFGFTAKLWGVEVDIATEPTNEDETEIRILSVRMEEKHLQKAGIWRCKVGFYYHMKKGRTVAESWCELPVSEERYIDILTGVGNEDSQAHKDVKEALTILTKLQGYDYLLGFHMELPKIREEEDDD